MPLGHAGSCLPGSCFSAQGMGPDHLKIAAVEDWPSPSSVSDLRSFLGLASYYRRYVHKFADIAAPLHSLTQKNASFHWDSHCQKAFTSLKASLCQAPVLAFPSLSSSAAPFSLQTDASATGIGAVLEQGGRVIAYASHSLTQAEQNYSVIQRECLAVVYAMKQFRHYLLGRRFEFFTDHALLQWLSAQKMEGLLARWALAIQEYDLTSTIAKAVKTPMLMHYPAGQPAPRVQVLCICPHHHGSMNYNNARKKIHDVASYCLKCSKCQAAKLPLPTRAPLETVPIGRPWQMVAVDILEVPISYHRNRYLLVIQDYFTKWADAIPLPDQTAERISQELVKVFSSYGMPEILHSDQAISRAPSFNRPSLHLESANPILSPTR